MKRLAASTPLVSLAAILVVLWVTNAGSVSFFSGGPGGGASTPQEPLKSQQGRVKPPRPGSDPLGGLGFWGVIAYVLLGVLLVALLAFVATATLSNHRNRLMHPVEADDVVGAFDASIVPAMLVETTEQQLAAIRHGSPRNAIVACWWQLERSSEATGFPRAPSETSSEFTQRVMSRYLVGATTIEGLAALYREARFSVHDMTEDDRERAVSALEQILADLRTPRPGSPVSAGR